jgi:hypothetical protein
MSAGARRRVRMSGTSSAIERTHDRTRRTLGSCHAFHPFRMLPEERVVHFALQRDIRRGFNTETGKTGRVHFEPDAFGSWPFVVNSANTSAQKIVNVIMAGPPNRRHSRLAPAASARSSSATFELRVRKAFRVRVAAIGRRASRHERVRARLAELLIPESRDVSNFSCR